MCPTCNQKSVQAFTGVSSGSTVPSEVVDLTKEVECAAEVAALTEHGAREEDAVPADGGGVVTADMGRVGARGGRADARDSSSGKVNQPAWAEAGGEGAATTSGVGAVGGGGKGKGRAETGPARGDKGRSGGKEAERQRQRSSGQPLLYISGMNRN